MTPMNAVVLARLARSIGRALRAGASARSLMRSYHSVMVGDMPNEENPHDIVVSQEDQSTLDYLAKSHGVSAATTSSLP